MGGDRSSCAEAPPRQCERSISPSSTKTLDVENASTPFYVLSAPACASGCPSPLPPYRIRSILAHEPGFRVAGHSVEEGVCTETSPLPVRDAGIYRVSPHPATLAGHLIAWPATEEPITPTSPLALNPSRPRLVQGSISQSRVVPQNVLGSGLR